MKKSYPTYIEQEALNLENIVVSGGKIGIQIDLKVEDLQKVTGAKTGNFLKS